MMCARTRSAFTSSACSVGKGALVGAGISTVGADGPSMRTWFAYTEAPVVVSDPTSTSATVRNFFLWVMSDLLSSQEAASHVPGNPNGRATRLRESCPRQKFTPMEILHGKSYHLAGSLAR